jgi:tetratricopeptide (TPR) repeat protein
VAFVYQKLENADIFFMRGRTLMALGKFPDAVFDFTWAIKLTEAEPQNDYKKLSECHRFAGQSYFEMC